MKLFLFLLLGEENLCSLNFTVLVKNFFAGLFYNIVRVLLTLLEHTFCVFCYF